MKREKRKTIKNAKRKSEKREKNETRNRRLSGNIFISSAQHEADSQLIFGRACAGGERVSATYNRSKTIFRALTYVSL
jgi:hypothetical protein